MKKITLLLLTFISAIGFAQEMPIDFDDSNDVFVPFNGAATSIIDDGGDMVLQMVGAANAWDGATITFANLVDLSDNSNNTITFWVKPTSASGTHLLKFEENVIGTGAPDTQLDFTTTGTAWQEITVDFGEGLGSYGKMSIFPDRGDDNASIAETYLFDDFSGGTSIDRPADATPPTTAPATPPALGATDVISLYSEAYTDEASNFDAGWCGAASVEEVMIAGNNVMAYKNNACQGIVLNNGIDATGFDKLHVDVYISPDVTNFDGKVFNLKFVNQPGGAAVEYNFNAGSTPPLTAGTWISIDIDVDLSGMTGFKEFGITSNLNGTLWYDNLYAYKSSALSTDEFSAFNSSVYPNPSSNSWTIDTPNNTIKTVEVFNVLGKKVLSQRVNDNTTSIPVASLASGIYLARVTTEVGTKTIKLIRE